jgi:hypothetical protein
MRKHLASLCLLSIAACKPTDVDAVRNAIPRAEDVQIKVPEPTARMMPELATFYVFTRDVSRTLNGGAGFILGMVKLITLYPVTTIDGDVYIWGPWTGDALDPAEYRLAVTDRGDGTYDWALEGRRKADGAAAAYQQVVYGHAEPGAVIGTGAGDFHISFATARALDPTADGEGELDVIYDLDGGTIAMHAESTPAGALEVQTFDYSYARQADGAGDFVFQLHGDTDDEGAAAEDIDVRSRWTAAGAGRSDVEASSGDLGTLVVTLSECWDGSYQRVYYEDSQSWNPTEGSEAACVFAEAALPE